MPLSSQFKDRCWETMWSICHSPYVNRFRIGYTFQPIHSRGSGYRNTGWHHIAVLADKLTRNDALELEEYLFTNINWDRRSVIYRKYDKTIRDGPYRRSAGGAPLDRANEPIHSVYIAWADLPLGQSW